VTALQLYFGPNINYATLPHASDSSNTFALNATNGGAGTLNVTITLNNSGAAQNQVYINLYCVQCGQTDLRRVDRLALTAMRGTPTSWNNQLVGQATTWAVGPFPFTLPTVSDYVVLVATVSCQPLNEGPTLTTPTQDPCVAVTVVPCP